MIRKRDIKGRFDSRPTATVEDRFQSQIERITESGCWIWMGSTRNFGYGAFKVGNRDSKVMHAHRMSWELYRGNIPDGMFVLHRCDIPSCVNPDHLFLGTADDNRKDMVFKNRDIKGSKTYSAKITEDIAAEIKKKSHTPTKVLAEVYGISRQSVADIIYGRTWKHVVI